MSSCLCGKDLIGAETVCPACGTMNRSRRNKRLLIGGAVWGGAVLLLILVLVGSYGKTPNTPRGIAERFVAVINDPKATNEQYNELLSGSGDTQYSNSAKVTNKNIRLAELRQITPYNVLMVLHKTELIKGKKCVFGIRSNICASPEGVWKINFDTSEKSHLLWMED